MDKKPKENLLGQMEILIKVLFKITNFVVSELLLGAMEDIIKDNGRIILCKEEANSFGSMGKSFKGTTSKI